MAKSDMRSSPAACGLGRSGVASCTLWFGLALVAELLHLANYAGFSMVLHNAINTEAAEFQAFLIAALCPA